MPTVIMLGYSALLMAVLVVGAPYWLLRMATSGRYRAGLAGRLGRVPQSLRVAVAGRRVVWVHAVSVGEVLAAVRLIEELRRVRPELSFAVSTTTTTGQELAQQRLNQTQQPLGENGAAVFYLPLDFRFVVRRYLRAIAPEMLVLIESELWPNLIAECVRRGVPVAVANARVSDRSFPRYMRLRRLWRPVLRQVAVFLAQSEETADRLRRMGAERVAVTGNVKYDARAVGQNRVAELVREAAAGRPIVVAGSTVEGRPRCEEDLVMQAMGAVWARRPETLLVLAPRHPNRFSTAYALVLEHGATRATEMLEGKQLSPGPRQTVLLDTIGDLAAVYGVADVAFVGGSLVQAGGHNPLEPAQFGVPVAMGGSVENFREIVGAMQRAEAIRMVWGPQDLGNALVELLTDRRRAQAMGERGREVFEAQTGATARTVAALAALLPEGPR